MLVLVVVEVDILEFNIVIGRRKFCFAMLYGHLVHFAEPAQAHIHEEQFSEVVEYQVNRIVDGRCAHDEHEVSEHVDFAFSPKTCARNQHGSKSHLENALRRIQEHTDFHVRIYLRFFVLDAVLVKMVEIGGFAGVGTDFLHVFEAFLDVFHDFTTSVVRTFEPVILNFLGKSNQKRSGRHHPKERDGHFPVVAEQHNADDGDASDGGEKFRHGVRENHFECVTIVHDGRRQIGEIFLAKERERQLAEPFCNRDAAAHAFVVHTIVCSAVRETVNHEYHQE